MSDDNLLTGAVNSFSAGGGLAGALLFARWLFSFRAGRDDAAVAAAVVERKEVSDLWKAYTKNQDRIVAELRAGQATQARELAEARLEIAQCHEDKALVEARLKALEVYDQADGDRSQMEQKMRALEQRLATLEGGTA